MLVNNIEKKDLFVVFLQKDAKQLSDVTKLDLTHRPRQKQEQFIQSNIVTPQC